MCLYSKQLSINFLLKTDFILLFMCVYERERRATESASQPTETRRTQIQAARMTGGCEQLESSTQAVRFSPALWLTSSVLGPYCLSAQASGYCMARISESRCQG